MGPLGAWVVTSIVVMGVGTAVAVVAGTIAVMHFPDELDPDRNERRYVAPAMAGVLVAGAGILSFVIAIVCIVIEAVTAT